MLERLSLNVVVTAVLLTSSTAPAAFNFTSQTRYVYGALGGQLGGAGPQQINAPGFGVFDATTNLTVPTYGGSANQHQHSELLPDKILYSGDVSIFRPAEVGTGIASATTSIDVTFDLTTTTQLALVASGTASLPGTDPRTISFTGPGTSINWSIFDTGMFPATSGSRSSNFTVGPGTYRFKSSFFSTNVAPPQTSFSVSSFNISLAEIPEPASMSLALLALASLVGNRRR